MSQRIVVVHIITKLELGGAQLNTVYTAEHLDPARFDVFLLSGPGGMLQSRLGNEGRLIVVSALGREVRPGRDLRALIQLFRLLRSIRPQVVHTHSSKAGILGRLAARLARVPVVVHSVHGFSFSPCQPFIQRTLYRLAERGCRRLTSHFVFVARSDIELARRRKLVGDNFSLIRSGFPMERFSAPIGDIAALRAGFGLPADSVVCGVIAPFKPQKGLLHLAAVAGLVIARNPAVRFFLAGDGEQRLRLEKELERLGIASHFHLPGFVREVEKAIDCFDIGVSTALWEGLPQSLVQMRLRHKPVVASDIPGNREVIREGESGFLVPVADHERFAAAILKLAGDPALRRRLGDFAAEDFSDWSADVLLARQEQLYQRLLVDSWNGG